MTTIQGPFIHLYPKLLLDSFGCVPSIIPSQIAPWLQSTLKWWKWIKLVTDSQRESLPDIKSCAWPADVQSSCHALWWETWSGCDRLSVPISINSQHLQIPLPPTPHPVFSYGLKTPCAFSLWFHREFLFIEFSLEMSHGQIGVWGFKCGCSCKRNVLLVFFKQLNTICHTQEKETIIFWTTEVMVKVMIGWASSH